MRALLVAASAVAAALVVVVVVLVVSLRRRTAHHSFIRDPGTHRCRPGRTWPFVPRYGDLDACAASLPIGWVEALQAASPAPPAPAAPGSRAAVPGVVLIITCERHLQDRAAHVALPDQVGGWPVVFVLGDNRIASHYEWRRVLPGRPPFLVLNCEDSYIHLFKKVAMAVDVVVNHEFDVRTGVLRCGDDIVFDVPRLEAFLADAAAHGDYVGSAMGKEPGGAAGPTAEVPAMLEYYIGHPDDLRNPRHGLRAVDTTKLELVARIPNFRYAIGTVFLLSLRACQVLVAALHAIAYNVFAPVLVGEYLTFPYHIEDVGVGWALREAGIAVTSLPRLVWPMQTPGAPPDVVARDTNFNR